MNADDDQPVATPRLIAGVRRNAVALISLTVALFGTSYNTWRNQATEAHRNVREASFKLLEEVGELQQITQRRHYGGDHSEINWIDGWGRATLIRDIAPLVSPAVQQRADDVYASWKTHAGDLGNGENDSEAAIERSLDALSGEIRSELQALH
jgi:hypothetical protein